jgi:hypothetical protein
VEADHDDVTSLLRDAPIRVWIGLAGVFAASALLLPGLLPVVIGPTYVAVDLADVRSAGEAKLVLDRRALRSRVDDGARLKVAAPDLAPARLALSDEGLIAAPPRRPKESPTRADRRVAVSLERQVNALLRETVGARVARASVAVRLDEDKRSERRLRFGRRGTALARANEQWRLTGDLERGRGRYRTTLWERDRAVRATRFDAPDIARLSVALVIDPAVGRKTARGLQRTVATAVGLDRRRGDVLRVARVRLDAAGRVRAQRSSPIAEHLPVLLLAAAISVFALVLWRGLRRVEHEPEDRAATPVSP